MAAPILGSAAPTVSADPAGVDRIELLDLAEKAAVVAARLIRDSDVAPEPCPKDDEMGLVTALDHAVEECVRRELLASRPEDGFLGEELVPVAAGSEVEWIVDPIDGTNNFVAGLPNWSISIAGKLRGRIEIGVVHAPALDHTYAACAGGGAWHNGRRLPRRSRHAPKLEDAMVATGFASAHGLREEQLGQLERVLPAVRDVRCHGAASLELCCVASGQLDAYYESDLRLWDVAAAALIATEAGVDVSGQPWSGSGSLVAAHPTLSDSLRGLVDQRADRG